MYLQSELLHTRLQLQSWKSDETEEVSSSAEQTISSF